MSDISNKFLRPNQEGRYHAQQSQLLYGLWTPYGILSPMSIGIWPDGTMDITYNMQQGAKFTKVQKRKITFITQRGVKVNIMHVKAGDDNA